MSFVVGLQEIRDIKAYAWHQKLQKKEFMEKMIAYYFKNKKHQEQLDVALRDYFKKR